MVSSTVVQDPVAASSAGSDYVDAFLARLCEEYEARGGVIIDFKSGVQVDFASSFAAGHDTASVPESPLDFTDLDDATPPGVGLEDLVRYGRVAAARQDQRINDLLTEAANDPSAWTDVEGNYPAAVAGRGMSLTEYQRHCRDLAVSAVALDIAVRTQLSEGQVHARASRAQVLAARCPRLWAAYLAGDVPEQNAAYAKTLVDELPADPIAWAAFDEQLVDAATRQNSGKFRSRARNVRERVHPESVNERHARAAKNRDVWVTPELDGIMEMILRVPATAGHAIADYLDIQSRYLATLPGETRTLAQLRADISTDLLLSGSLAALPDDIVDAVRAAAAGGNDARDDATDTADGADAPGDPETDADTADLAEVLSGSETGADTADDADAPSEPDTDAPGETEAPVGAAGPNETLPSLKGITPTVRITIPALALLGHSDEPATLDGYGPIDIETAKRLAGRAKSWIRVLTHPVTGTILNVDRKTYRVPADLRRWLDTQYPTCIAPGCTRPAHRCDIDHRTRWADGGTTDAENLCPLCEHHHIIKDETLWQLIRDKATSQLYWVSPTGFTTRVDPPLDTATSTPAADPATTKYDGPPPF
ncbi:HNH endonuclease signature motif containing protein [Microbacterium invictum]|uniref:HNH nuclease domain-containing protein n=1 Tax=Microbacterium invictum TaxID=515415 RepID=A0AA40VKE4_9MICO|nr:HNH endonuclease signature motif containing protein [Microbacterium invictum]MBB4138524.1 hypothetical protein [Microbacterium invictum]